MQQLHVLHVEKIRRCCSGDRTPWRYRCAVFFGCWACRWIDILGSFRCLLNRPRAVDLEPLASSALGSRLVALDGKFSLLLLRGTVTWRWNSYLDMSLLALQAPFPRLRMCPAFNVRSHNYAWWDRSLVEGWKRRRGCCCIVSGSLIVARATYRQLNS